MMGFRVFVSVMKSKIETAANHVLTICLGNARFSYKDDREELPSWVDQVI